MLFTTNYSLFEARRDDTTKVVPFETMMNNWCNKGVKIYLRTDSKRLIVLTYNEVIVPVLIPKAGRTKRNSSVKQG